MEIHFRIVGVLLILLAIIHIAFPKYFNWKEELKPLSLINKQIMVVHTFFIGLVVFLMGVLCLISTKSLIQTKLGHTLTLGLFVFWIIRLFFQLFVYSSKLWKTKTFETTIHIVFIIFWTYISGVFLWATLT